MEALLTGRIEEIENGTGFLRVDSRVEFTDASASSDASTPTTGRGGVGERVPFTSAFAFFKAGDRVMASIQAGINTATLLAKLGADGNATCSESATFKMSEGDAVRVSLRATCTSDVKAAGYSPSASGCADDVSGCGVALQSTRSGAMVPLGAASVLLLLLARRRPRPTPGQRQGVDAF